MKLTTEQCIHLRETLKAILSMGESQIVFEKADGSIRSMRCTRDKDVIPSDIIKESGGQTRKYTESTTSIPVYDTESEGWRSFAFSNIISINGRKVSELVAMISTK